MNSVEFSQDQLGQWIRNFKVQGDIKSIEAHHQGHINDTFFVSCTGGEYVLQRINHHVFHDPKAVMENILRVTEHLKKTVPQSQNLEVIMTTKNQAVFLTPQGQWWRMYGRIGNSKTFNQLQSAEQAYEVGRAFAQFQQSLSTLPQPRLTDTIPNFHNTHERFLQLIQVKVSNPKRKRLVSAELQFAKTREDFCKLFGQLMDEKKIPERIVHNDTKLNNILFDQQTGKSLCVIDLDTVMPGTVLYDFGDLVRTCACVGGEDNEDLNQLKIDLNIYRQLVKGYLSVAKSFLSPIEIEYLPQSGAMITLELGMRFLCDFLAGDVYFKTTKPFQNLVRARTQFRYVELLETTLPELKKITAETLT